MAEEDSWGACTSLVMKRFGYDAGEDVQSHRVHLARRRAEFPEERAEQVSLAEEAPGECVVAEIR